MTITTTGDTNDTNDISADERLARELQQQQQDEQMARELETQIQQEADRFFQNSANKDQQQQQQQQQPETTFSPMVAPAFVDPNPTTTTSTSNPPEVVVRGTSVPNPHTTAATQPSSSFAAALEYDASASPPPTRQSKCQDPLFAIMFYVDVVAIIVVAAVFGGDAMSSETSGSNSNFSDDYGGYINSAAIAGIFGLILSAVGLKVMMMIPGIMVKAALIFSVVLAGLFAVYGFFSGSIFLAVLLLAFFAMTCCYAYCVWSRIPFATVNLVTGITCIKANGGITIFAYVFVIAAAIWSVIWAVAMMGTFDKTYVCDDPILQTNCTFSGQGYFLLFLLFLCYFFVHQVLQNTIHVTIAGIVATWWIVPEEGNRFFSKAIFDSLKRSFTTSFGSICFGSLLVAIVQALRMLANAARAQDDGILLCLAECILACIEGLLEYFNKWAFIYTGIYGMSYCESGKQVINLFKNRGWEAIIADDLVTNVFLLVSLIVGGITGVGAIIVEQAAGWFEEDAPGNPNLTAFLLGLIVGFVLCSILMSTIASSVNAVIVLFAEKPNEFQTNHPELSQKMREKWSEIYPGIL